jgi:hypothetical protein
VRDRALRKKEEESSRKKNQLTEEFRSLQNAKLKQVMSV